MRAKQMGVAMVRWRVAVRVKWIRAVMEMRRVAAMDSWKEVGTEMTVEKVAMAKWRVEVSRVKWMGAVMVRWRVEAKATRRVAAMVLPTVAETGQVPRTPSAQLGAALDYSPPASQ